MTNPSQDQINTLVDLYYTGQMAKIEEVSRELLKHYPQSLIVLNLLGAALRGQGKAEEAVRTFDKVIEINPDDADAYNSRGGAQTDIGSLEDAVKDYIKAIELEPGYVAAHRNLSDLKNYKPDDAQIELMERLLADKKLSESDHKHLYFALSRAYGDLGEYDKSYAYLSQGNLIRKKELDYRIGDDRQMISAIKETFSIENPIVNSISEIQPVFIVGMPRSGTSLVEQIMASHSKVFGAGELDMIFKFVSPILSRSLDKHGRQHVGQLSENEIRTLQAAYLNTLCALNTPERVITDKTPLNFLLIGFILSAFPNAKIIHVNRDSRATCWSIFKHYFSGKGHGFAYDLEDIVAFYKLYSDLMTLWHEKYPNSIYDLCYEDLTENQAEETRKVLAFCDLEWEDQCLDFHETKRVVRTASAAQVRKKMYRGSSDAWRNYEKHLQLMIKGLGY